MKAYLGIDPGKSGGIAILAEGQKPFAVVTPETERDIWDVIFSLRSWCDLPTVAVIEAVHSMPKQGVASSFTFGRGYGALRMALIAAGIPFRDVTPQAWQKSIGCMTKGNKGVSLAKAQQMFPDAPWGKTKAERLAIADALLIAEWLRRQP